MVAKVHSEKSAVLLRRNMLRGWVNGGQRRWHGKRPTAVSVGGMRILSMYQPVWGTYDQEREELRRRILEQLTDAGRERVIIGSDFNSNIRKNQAKQGVCGQYGLGRASEAGSDHCEWCEESELVMVHSCVRHNKQRDLVQC